MLYCRNMDSMLQAVPELIEPDRLRLTIFGRHDLAAIVDILLGFYLPNAMLYRRKGEQGFHAEYE